MKMERKDRYGWTSKQDQDLQAGAFKMTNLGDSIFNLLDSGIYDSDVAVGQGRVVGSVTLRVQLKDGLIASDLIPHA